jgi:hypothetical protein
VQDSGNDVDNGIYHGSENDEGCDYNNDYDEDTDYEIDNGCANEGQMSDLNTGNGSVN